MFSRPTNVVSGIGGLQTENDGNEVQKEKSNGGIQT